MLSGREFNADGPACEKARSPKRCSKTVRKSSVRAISLFLTTVQKFLKRVRRPDSFAFRVRSLHSDSAPTALLRIDLIITRTTRRCFSVQLNNSDIKNWYLRVLDLWPFSKGLFTATQLNSTELNSTAWTTVDSICRSWRHKQKHDWLGCTLFNWVSWVQLSWVVSL